MVITSAQNNSVQDSRRTENQAQIKTEHTRQQEEKKAEEAKDSSNQEDNKENYEDVKGVQKVDTTA